MGLVWANDPESYADGSLAVTMPDRSKVMSQIMRSNLVLPVGGWALGCQSLPTKICVVEKLLRRG
jgi:hypothetical protein